MAGLKDIKTRIASVKGTQKITNAMKLVSAAKFARAGQAVQAARPYATAFNELLGNLLRSRWDDAQSPLLDVRPVRNVLLIILGTDRGLAGGINANLFKAVNRWRNELPAGVTMETIAWGRKAISYVKRTNQKVLKQQEKVLEKPNYEFAKATAKEIVDLFLEHTYDQIFIVYPKFVSAMAQTPTVEQLLPVAAMTTPKDVTAGNTNFDVEPDFAEILDDLLERKLVGTIFNAMLESAASEHGARMSAMESATRNAKEVVKKLTLKYNRARQAMITTELTEIISGAQALD